MKNILKKVMAVGMIFALIVVVSATSVQKADAAKLYVFGLDLVVEPEDIFASQYIGTRGILFDDPMELTGNTSLRLAGLSDAKPSYAKYCKVKSMSIKSSNSKILKVDGKKATAQKIGTASLTYKVVFTHTAKSGELEYPVYKKCKNDDYGMEVIVKKKKVEKGKTYTLEVKVPYAVVCKKHKYAGKWKVTREATCANDGEKQKKCKQCSHIERRYIAKKKHKWGEWKVIKEATDTQAAEEERICSVCNEKETRVR